MLEKSLKNVCRKFQIIHFWNVVFITFRMRKVAGYSLGIDADIDYSAAYRSVVELVLPPVVNSWNSDTFPWRMKCLQRRQTETIGDTAVVQLSCYSTFKKEKYLPEIKLICKHSNPDFATESQLCSSDETCPANQISAVMQELHLRGGCATLITFAFLQRTNPDQKQYDLMKSDCSGR